MEKDKKVTTTKKVAPAKKVVKAEPAKKVVKAEPAKKVVKKENKKIEAKNNTRISLCTVIVLLILVFTPLILITSDMQYTYFRDNIFAQDFFTSNTNLNNISVSVGVMGARADLATKDKMEMLKLLSKMKIKKSKLIQMESAEGVYINDNHTYIRITNLETSKSIEIKVEGSIMDVQGYIYKVEDSLHTAAINVFIDKLI